MIYIYLLLLFSLFLTYLYPQLPNFPHTHPYWGFYPKITFLLDGMK